jgi:hypothetical protein
VPDPLWLEGEANRELIPLIALVGTCAIVVVITAPARIGTSTNFAQNSSAVSVSF